MKTMNPIHQILGASALALCFAACGDDGNNNDNGGNGDTTTPSLCRSAVDAKLRVLSSQVASWSIADATEMVDTSGDQTLASFAGAYRDNLGVHPGCAPRTAYDGNTEFLVSDNEATVAAGSPADITGYDCAAKEYDQPAEDTSLPIVILVHGNSSSITSFEEYDKAALRGQQISNVTGFLLTVDNAVRTQLASELVAAGHRVIAFDARVDLVATQGGYSADGATGNPFRNIDHGWAVPMLMDLIRAVMTNNPTRQVSIVGHSLGSTVTRDALRRLFNEWKAGTSGAVNPYAQLADVVLASGANHGVSTGGLLCDSYPNLMRGTVTCEMGDRDNFEPTYFTQPLNGPADLFATPCADGSFAFGMEDQCGDNVVEYTTITMEDLPDGALQDEFVSEASSKIDMNGCVDNVLIGLDDFDSSGYFFTGFPGFFANHFGSVRSDAGLATILAALAD